MLTETLPHGPLVPWKRRRGGCFSSAGELPERFTAGANACLGEGEKEPERPQRRINTRATMATMRGTFSSLLLCRSTAPLTGLAYVLQRLHRFRAVCVNGHVSVAYCVWTEYFFDNDCGPFALSSSCGRGFNCGSSLPFREHTALLICLLIIIQSTHTLVLLLQLHTLTLEVHCTNTLWDNDKGEILKRKHVSPQGEV